MTMDVTCLWSFGLDGASAGRFRVLALAAVGHHTFGLWGKIAFASEPLRAVPLTGFPDSPNTGSSTCKAENRESLVTHAL